MEPKTINHVVMKLSHFSHIGHFGRRFKAPQRRQNLSIKNPDKLQ